MGGKSSSSSQANQTTNTALNDSRVTNRDGVVAGDGAQLDMSQFFSQDNSMQLSSWDASSSWADNSMKLSSNSATSWADNSMKSTNTNTNTTSGSYNNSVDSDITGQAFDFAKGVDATIGAGLSSVLTFAKDITNKASDNTNSLATMFGQGVNQAYDNANNTTAGGIDNKTMIVLGVAAAGAVAAIAMSKRG